MSRMLFIIEQLPAICPMAGTRWSDRPRSATRRPLASRGKGWRSTRPQCLGQSGLLQAGNTVTGSANQTACSRAVTGTNRIQNRCWRYPCYGTGRQRSLPQRLPALFRLFLYARQPGRERQPISAKHGCSPSAGERPAAHSAAQIRLPSRASNRSQTMRRIFSHARRSRGGCDPSR
jgi:hypothetical protein